MESIPSSTEQSRLQPPRCQSFHQFVDPNTSVHTQNIENTWILVKRKHKKQGEFNRNLLTSYLEESCGDKNLETNL